MKSAHALILLVGACCLISFLNLMDGMRDAPGTRRKLMLPEPSSDSKPYAQPAISVDEMGDSLVANYPSASFEFVDVLMSRSQQNGLLWVDSVLAPIQGHGGCVIQHKGQYYWYGETKTGITRDNGFGFARADSGGISVYSSTDLKLWTFEGKALALSMHHSAEDLAIGRVIERPRVLYHSASSTFVMWLHIDDYSYSDARVGVAVSRTPVGPFSYLGSFRPNGEQSRDLTVFQDIDEAAYLIYSSNDNADMHVSPLTSDYLQVHSSYTNILPGQKREAPIVWRMGDLYFMWTSGCTGWKPNTASIHVATSVLGPWLLWGMPTCTSPPVDSASMEYLTELDEFGMDMDADATDPCLFTFGSQGTWAIPYPEGTLSATSANLLWMADAWDETNLPASGYVWLQLLLLDNSDPESNLADRIGDISVSISFRDRWYAGIR